jgi:hypothetical protein
MLLLLLLLLDDGDDEKKSFSGIDIEIKCLSLYSSSVTFGLLDTWKYRRPQPSTNAP